MEFTTIDGEVLNGKLVRSYSAFEGGMRYIIEVDGKEYRCIQDEHGNYIEYIP